MTGESSPDEALKWEVTRQQDLARARELFHKWRPVVSELGIHVDEDPVESEIGVFPTLETDKIDPVALRRKLNASTLFEIALARVKQDILLTHGFLSTDPRFSTDLQAIKTKRLILMHRSREDERLISFANQNLTGGGLQPEDIASIAEGIAADDHLLEIRGEWCEAAIPASQFYLESRGVEFGNKEAAVVRMLTLFLSTLLDVTQEVRLQNCKEDAKAFLERQGLHDGVWLGLVEHLLAYSPGDDS